MEQQITPGQAQEFYQASMYQLDHLLLGEREAKLAVVTTMVMGENVLLVGPPGGGKTTLAMDAYRIVEGIEADHVAEIPPLADLNPQQLVGGYARSEKEVTHNGETSTERTSTKIEPIIEEGTKVIFANEINRINPFAVNAMLEVLESGTIQTTAGSAKLKGLEYGVSTMNPSEARQGTFPITAATASRHSIGALLGSNFGSDEASRHNAIQSIMVGGWEPAPEKMTYATDLNTLRNMRESAKRIPIPHDLGNRAAQIVARTVDALRETHPSIPEADGRIAKQLGRISKTLAFLGAQDRVTEEQLNLAVKYVVSARLGALSTNASAQIAEIVPEITR